MGVQCSRCDARAIMPGRPGRDPIRCSHCGSTVDVEFVRDFRPWLLASCFLSGAGIVFISVSRVLGVICGIVGISTALVFRQRLRHGQLKTSVSSIPEIAALIRNEQCIECGSAVRATGTSRINLPGNVDAILLKSGLPLNQLIQKIEIRCLGCGRTAIVEVDVSQMPEIIYGANLISGVDHYLAKWNRWDKDPPYQRRD